MKKIKCLMSMVIDGHNNVEKYLLERMSSGYPSQLERYLDFPVNWRCLLDSLNYDYEIYYTLDSGFSALTISFYDSFEKVAVMIYKNLSEWKKMNVLGLLKTVKCFETTLAFNENNDFLGTIRVVNGKEVLVPFNEKKEELK